MRDHTPSFGLTTRKTYIALKQLHRMVNTMADLRAEVASRLRNSLHGREIDKMQGVDPELPHMLGITPLNKVHDPMNEEMTVLDTKHQFWQEYEEDITTAAQVEEKIETAIRSLKEDGVFRMTYPYGEEAEIVYVEVDKLNNRSNSMKTSCKECGNRVTTAPSLELIRGSYHLTFSVDCPECDFSGNYTRNLIRE